MTSHLRVRKGWSPERRARQAALIRQVKPWLRSTGPKTEEGKARCAANALRHGGRSRARIRQFRRIRYVLRLADRNIRLVRLVIRFRCWPKVLRALLRSANGKTSLHSLRKGRNIGRQRDPRVLVLRPDHAR